VTPSPKSVTYYLIGPLPFQLRINNYLFNKISHLGSNDASFDGFIGLISSPGSFPLTRQEGFELRAGHINIISLTSTIVEASDDLRSLDQTDRQCLFPGVNFINALMQADPKSAKRQSSCQSFLCFHNLRM